MHYEADASYTGPVYSGYKSGGFTFAPLIIHNGNDKYQHISTWYTLPPEVTTFANAQFQAVIGRLKLRKTDVGGKLLDGAIFHVTGNNFDQDVTVTNGEIVLDNLLVGEYTITEKNAPHGYLVNTATFSTTVKPGETSEVTITDEAPTGQILIKKSDADGLVQGEASLEGAEYTVYNSENKEVGKIMTDKTGRGQLNNLVLGIYTVKETKAPVGYNLDPQTYTVELTYKDQTTSIVWNHVESQDKVKVGQIEILKSDTNNQPLKGGEFGIYANNDMYIGHTLYKKGQLVMSIKTNDKGIAKSGNLPYGSYYVKELSAPDQEDGNKENFVLSDETQYVKITGDKLFSMTFVDTTVTASKRDIAGTDEIKGAKMQVTDMNGKIIDTWTSTNKPHSIKGLTEGHDYILTEITAPNGFVKAESIKFTVSKEKKNQAVVMKDKQVKISKTDLTGEKEVVGAHLEVRDELNKVVDSWTSSEEAHYVSGLEEGKTYTLIETTAPDGYAKAESITFTVSKENQEVVMKDAEITIHKVDEETEEPVLDAQFSVFDKEGNLIDQWITDGKAHAVSHLEAGKEYILKETKTPRGYQTVTDTTFTVSGEEDLSLEIKEKPILVNIQVNKVDAKTKQLIKDKDFEFTLYKDPDCIYSMAAASSKDGSATFKDLRYGTYYIKETKAPFGYHLSTEVKKVVIDENVKGDTYTFDYENTPIEIIQTGDPTNLLMIIGLGLVSMISIIFILIKKES